MAFDSVAKSSVSSTNTVTSTKTYPVSTFHSLEVCGPINVTLTDGNSDQIIASGDSKMLAKLQVSVSNGDLKISFPKEICKKVSKKSKFVDVKIGVQTLRSIELGMSATLRANDIQAENALNIEAETATKVKIGKVIAKSVKLEAETSAFISVAEIQVDTLSIEADTSASVDVKKSAATKIKVSSDTAASVTLDKVQADRFEADADTAASIEIAGRAKTAILKADTAGSINASALTCPSISQRTDTAGSVKVK